MMRTVIALTAVGSAAASAIDGKGVFLNVLSSNLKANATWKSLLEVATDSVSEDFHRGMIAPFNQSGYEYSLGNAAMTAFITKWISDEGLEVVDPDGLQGFVMYYDGSCHKKAFKNLAEELRDDARRISCSGDWLKRTDPSLLESKRQVGDKEFNAMLLKENIATRAAAYKAGQEASKNVDSITSVRKFVRDYINELHGSVLNELKLEIFIGDFISDESNAEDPLEKLTDALMAESEKPDGACVKLPPFSSRTVTLLETRPPTKRQDKYLFVSGLTTNGSKGLYASKGNYYEGEEKIIYKDPENGMWKIVGKSKKAQVLGAGPYDASAWTACNVSVEEACDGFSEFIQNAAGTWESQQSHGVVGGVGTTAPLDESGYMIVVNTGDTMEMSKFVNRTAQNMSMTINKGQVVPAFAKWYDGSCAIQSFAAMQSELKSMVERPAVCGGGWVSASPSMSQWRSKVKRRHGPLRR